MIFVSEAALWRAASEFLAHYHGERNHQGLRNELIAPLDDNAPSTSPIECHQRLGGLLKFYRRSAA